MLVLPLLAISVFSIRLHCCYFRIDPVRSPITSDKRNTISQIRAPSKLYIKEAYATRPRPDQTSPQRPLLFETSIYQPLPLRRQQITYPQDEIHRDSRILSLGVRKALVSTCKFKITLDSTTTIAFALPQEEDRGKKTAPCPKDCPRNKFDSCDCN